MQSQLDGVAGNKSLCNQKKKGATSLVMNKMAAVARIKFKNLTQIRKYVW